MPLAENEEKKVETPVPAKRGAADDVPPPLPDWGTQAVDFLKTYQNVFYALAIVVLVVWFVIKFRADQKEKDELEAELKLARATSVDTLRGLAEDYKSLDLAPRIHFAIARKLDEEEKPDEALKEFELINQKWPESLPGKLAGQRLKTARENAAWKAIEAEKLKKLAEAGGDEKTDPNRRDASVIINDAELPQVEVDTTKGKIVLELDEDGSPNTVANFIAQVEKGYYEKTKVNKVEKDVAVWMGDPLPEGNSPKAFTIPFEAGKLPLTLGMVAMVRDLPPEGQPDTDALKNTASTQFAIFTGLAPAYEGKYLIFGRVREGLDAVRALAPGDTINAVKVLRKRSHKYEPKISPK